MKFNPNELLIFGLGLYPWLLNKELFPGPLIFALDALNIPELFILKGFILLLELLCSLLLLLLFIPSLLKALLSFIDSLLLFTLLEVLLLLLEKLILK